MTPRIPLTPTVRLTKAQKARGLRTLDQIRALLATYGWVQDRIGNPDVGFCLLGALEYVHGSGVARQALAIAIVGEVLFDPAFRGNAVSLTDYNDTEGRTYRQILGTIRRARTLLARDNI